MKLFDLIAYFNNNTSVRKIKNFFENFKYFVRLPLKRVFEKKRRGM